MPPSSERLFFPDHSACRTLTATLYDELSQQPIEGRERDFVAGEALWLPHDPADSVCFLRAGQVSVTREDSHGHEVILHVVGPDELFGELCFCSREGGRRNTTARSVGFARAVCLSYSGFLGALRAMPELLEAAVQSFCVRLSDLEERIDVLARQSAEDRIGHLLLHLAASKGEPASEDGAALVRASHDTLARMAAMSRSHVTVTMGRFRQRGLVDYARRTPLTVHLAALREYLADLPDRRRDGP